ncbi:MAG: sulfur oxidation c-type cytochrome SoxA [Halothiobacillaceae bacterium]
MKKILFGALAASVMAASGVAHSEVKDSSDPAEFREIFIQYFEDRFPQIDKSEYNMGVYSLLPDAKAQWEDQMMFPAYEQHIVRGEEVWNTTKFPNGETFESCLGPAKGLRAKYPFFDTEADEVRVLEEDLIRCQEANGVKEPWNAKSKDLKAVSAYLSNESRGMTIDVAMPDDPAAVEAFNKGKEVWYRKTGQLNMACADCHQYHSGQNARAETLSYGVGKTAHWPLVRYSRGDGLFTLHQRFNGCMRSVRAIGYGEYSPEFKNLEFFLSYIDNGIEINGPNLRK